MAQPSHENWLEGLDPPDFSCREEQSELPQDPASESDSEVIINVPTQSPETSDTEATFHTPPKDHPLWTEGLVGSATQLVEGRKSTFVTHLLERTCSLSSIFHPNHLIRDGTQSFKKEEIPSKVIHLNAHLI